MPSPSRPPLLQLLVALIAGLLAAAPAAVAQSISAQVGSTRAYLNEPLRITVRIANAGEFDGPTFEQPADLEIRRLPGEQTSSNVSIINGRRSEQRTVSMNFEAMPRRTGQFTIPAFTITTDGRTLSSAPISITVVESNSAELLFLRVRSTPATLYVGQRGTLDLEIWARRFTDAALGVTLDEASMWSLVDAQSSSWGVFGPTVQRMFAENRRPRGEIRIEGNAEFIVFTVSKPFDPIAAGPPQLGDLRIRMEYPTGLQRDRSFFLSSGYALSGSRTLSVVPQSATASALPVPEGGRPDSWNGAVGDFEIVVVAKPLDVAVGDPITLTMRLSDRSGTAAMDGLQAPRLDADPAFSTAFRLPSEAASGVVEGSSKVFTQSIRAQNDAVREIPGVEFSFFNPASGRYESARSAPIPLRVKPSAIVRIDAGDAAAPEDPSAGAARGGFKRIEGGLVANASVAESGSRGTVGAGELALGLGVPLAIGLVPWGVSALSRGGDPRRLRKDRALAALEAALAISTMPDAVEGALLEFIAARLGIAAGGFSRKDALDGLARAGVSAPVLEQAERFLRECERARYVGGAIDPDAARAVARAIEAATAAARVNAPGRAA